jgi:hypothetical protein
MASIRRRSNGKWRARYRDASGKEHARHFERKADAERFLDRMRGDLARGAWIDPRDTNLTVREIGQRWLDSNPAKRPTTWVTDESHLRVHVYPALGDRRIGTITRADVQAALNAWSRTMRPRSARRVFGVARAVFAFAAENDWLAKSPCRGVKPRPWTSRTSGP